MPKHQRPTLFDDIVKGLDNQYRIYKAHATETCDDDTPHLITNVATTAGPTADGAATSVIHAALEGRERPPGVHLVDSGCLDAPSIVASQTEHGVALRRPARPDY